jgi:hypothetical protein
MNIWQGLSFASTGVCIVAFIAILWLYRSGKRRLNEQRGLLVSLDIKIAQLEVATKRYTEEAERYERALAKWKRI